MSKPRRIAFDARYINDRYHGIGRFAFRLLEALVAAAPEDTFIVYRGRTPDSRFNWPALTDRPNVESQPGPWPLYWPHEQLMWPQLLRRAAVDLIYTPYFVAPVISGVPAVITVMDLVFDRYPQYMPQSWTRPYYKVLMRRSIKHARHIVTLSQATAGDLQALYRVAAAKIKVIPAAVDPLFVPISDTAQLASLRGKYGLARPFVLAVGARRPHKNLGRLVEAYARIAGQVDHDLVLIGPADDRFPDDARQVTEDAHLQERVHFLGWVAEQELPGLYSLAHVVAVPSLIEGFGLPALEAMACGTPVLASQSSSIPEVVGEAGLLVDPTSVEALSCGLQQLLSQPELRQRLRTAGLRRANQFSWAGTARQLLAVYDRI